MRIRVLCTLLIKAFYPLVSIHDGWTRFSFADFTFIENQQTLKTPVSS